VGSIVLHRRAASGAICLGGSGAQTGLAVEASGVKTAPLTTSAESRRIATNYVISYQNSLAHGAPWPRSGPGKGGRILLPGPPTNNPVTVAEVTFGCWLFLCPDKSPAGNDARSAARIWVESELGAGLTFFLEVAVDVKPASFPPDVALG